MPVATMHRPLGAPLFAKNITSTDLHRFRAERLGIGQCGCRALKESCLAIKQLSGVIESKTLNGANGLLHRSTLCPIEKSSKTGQQAKFASGEVVLALLMMMMMHNCSDKH